MTTLTNIHMEHALKLAKAAGERGEVPVGAIIVEGTTGEVIAEASNRVIEDKDPTAHAEILAIRTACQKIGNERLNNCDLYVTLEPCPMCAQAISFARVRRLYFASSDRKGGGVESGALVFNASSCHHKPDVYGGIMEVTATALLKDFFIKRR